LFNIGWAALYAELRPGRPRTIEDEQIAAPLKRTLSRKPVAGTHWTVREMARASGISKSTVHRLRFALQPHRSLPDFRLTDNLSHRVAGGGPIRVPIDRSV
jgi:hypothetical protein